MVHSSITHGLDQVIYFVFMIPLVAAPFLVFNWIRYLRSRRATSGVTRRFPAASVGFFAVPILTVFAMAAVIRTTAQGEVGAFLSDLKDADVSVNGAAVPSPAAALDALRSMREVMGHHSHPEARLRVVIRSNKGTLTLYLGRDSQDPREYWVFYPGYRSTETNEIGRIVSDAFAAY